LFKVALDIHQFSMLKNKIYKYLSNEILKNFITILLTFSAIAWVVRSVNFLDLMVEDGYNSSVYFKYSLLNISTIISRFVPLAFLVSLIMSIVKFERQQELLILWTSGLNKIKIANLFLLIAFFITLFQIILSSFVNPFLLNKSRSLLRISDTLQITSTLKSNDFSDTFKGLTFFISEKNVENELLNILIKDTSGNLNTLVKEVGESNNTTIVAKKGIAGNNKLILFNGFIQTLNKKNEIKNIQFEKTELSLINMSARTIIHPKLQETSTGLLLKCIFDQNKNLDIFNCSKKKFKSNSVETLSKRLVSPLYIPLITIIVSFLLAYKKERKFFFLKKYILFFLSFSLLVLAEIFLKYTGFSWVMAISYFSLPLILSMIFYIYLVKKITVERRI